MFTAVVFGGGMALQWVVLFPLGLIPSLFWHEANAKVFKSNTLF